MFLFKKLFQIVILFLCVIFPIAKALAQDLEGATADTKQEAKQLSFSSASSYLPKSSDQQERYYISSRNEAEFRDYLLAPIGKLLFQNKLMFRAFSELAFSFTVSDEWEEGSRANTLIYRLDGANIAINATEPDAAQPKPGFPFGFASDIDSEADPKKKAYKILWNAAYTQGKASQVQYVFEMSWVGAQSFLRKATATVYREFYRKAEKAEQNVEPAKDGEAEKATEVANDSNDIMLKELLQFSNPVAVKNLSEVTWRERDAKEDTVWIYSPVVGRSRRVLQSNRSDPILGSILSYNDLFVFSEKIQSFDAQVVANKSLLALFPSHLPYQFGDERVRTDLEEGGLGNYSEQNPTNSSESPVTQSALVVNGEYLRQDSSRISTIWNYETRQYPQAAAWVPTSAFAVPRNVWIIEITPLDPFTANGKILLAVDQESMLPLIKIVYDKRGKHKKIIFAGWNLAKTKDGKLNFPVLSFLLAIEPNGEKAVSLVMQYVRVFNQTRPASLAALLDIENHGKDMPETTEEDSTLDSETSEESLAIDRVDVEAVDTAQSVTVDQPTPEIED
jgi:hypothetical protein